jgi:hypothetical protein
MKINPFETALKEAYDQKAQHTLKDLTEGSFHNFPSSNQDYSAGNLEGISRIRIFKSPADADKENVERLLVIPVYKRNGKDCHTTLTLNLDGTLAGRLDKDFPVDRDALKTRVLEILETEYGIPMETCDGPVLPRGEGEKRGKKNLAEEKKEKGLVDERRLKFFTKHPDALFAFHEKKKNEDSEEYYRIFVFKKYMIGENPVGENAAYLFPLKNPLNIKQGERPIREDRQKFIKENWDDIYAGLPKQDVRERGARQIIHPKREQNDDAEWYDKWQAKMTEETEAFIAEQEKEKNS